MHKKRLHKARTRLRILSPWYFLVMAVIFGSVSALALRQNNLQMIKLRDKVFAADKSGGDIEGTLRDLREFVYSHMNTDLSSGTGVKPPIQLKYSYDRLTKAEHDRVDSYNAKIYTSAQHYCEQFISHVVFGGASINCIKNYVSSHDIKASPVPDDLYKFDFVSPAWTPDLAGLTLLAAVLSFILFVLRFGLELWLKHELHDQM